MGNRRMAKAKTQITQPYGDSTSSRHVVVVGGGLAGLTCTLELSQSGVPTTLVEHSPYVGGKTFSFVHPKSEIEIDNGQHVYLRCCTAYLSLIERLGLTEKMLMQKQFHLPVLDPNTGTVSSISSNPSWMRAPYHLSWSILRFSHLNWREKFLLIRAMIPIWRMDLRERQELDNTSFANWLRGHGQSEQVIERFWDLIVLPTCNDRSETVSACQAIMVFQSSLFINSHDADIGIPTISLSKIANAMVQAIESAEGEVKTKTGVRMLHQNQSRIEEIGFSDGSTQTVNAVVLAVPPNAAKKLLSQIERTRAECEALSSFRYSPIVNIYIHWDRVVMEETFLSILDPMLQYVFNRNKIDASLAKLKDDSQWIVCSISGAHTTIEKNKKAIASEAITALRQALPLAAVAEVLHWNVIIEKEATFRPLPGIGNYRLGTKTSLQNLFLAGAWTDTEWPATMESAVISGQNAAAAVLNQINPADRSEI